MKYLFLVLLSVACASKPVPSPTKKSGFTAVNGINMYYEIYGKSEGTPLVLIHGGGSTIDVTWEKMIPLLSKNHKVIAVEEQGHGRTTDRNAPVDFAQTADDIASLLKELKVSQVDLFGFSNGASVAMMMSIRHPELVRKMIYASSISKKSGAYPWFWEYMKKANFENMPQPLKTAYLKVNPDPAKLRTMHDKDADRMRNFKDIPDKDVKTIKAQTLILCGDKELVRPEHAVELTHLIAHSRLMILPAGHGDYLGEAIMTKPGSKMHEATAALVEEFLSLK